MSREKKTDRTKRPAENAWEQERETQTSGASVGQDEADVSVVESPAGEETVEETADTLREQLENARDKYIRLMAEFDNYKRRTGREYRRMVERANEELVLEFIEVRESFERALRTGRDSVEGDSFFDGMKMIFSKLDEVLCKNGLSVFTEVGEEFNPELHDALMKTPHDTIPADHIAEVFEKGYRLRDHVIKHGRVIVSSGPGQETAETEPAPADSDDTQTDND
jgi:molecular chaperone GrpE